MVLSKEILVDMHEAILKVIRLLEDVNTRDDAPFLHEYAAREILQGLKDKIENFLESDEKPEEKQTLTNLYTAVIFFLGKLSINIEELSTGINYLRKCENLLKDREPTPDTVLLMQNCFIQLGIASFELCDADFTKPKELLEKAEKLYYDYKAIQFTPIDIPDLFNPNLDERSSDLAWSNFEKNHTFTLYYLAQVYGSLKDYLKSSVYCHNTLQRQLDSKSYDPIDWALNSATLSQFFTEQNCFKQARHHLSGSLYVLDAYKAELDAVSAPTEAHDAKMEQFKHRSADVARCWAKYGLLLLQKSKERLLNHADDDLDVNCTLASDLKEMALEGSSISKTDLESLDFKNLDLTQYEAQITAKFVLTVQDARLVFLNIQSWLQKAEAYYAIETHASDNIEIVLDQSQMYANFLFFEDSADSQAKLIKRQIDLLEGVVGKVNPKFYLSYCRQIWYDLGDYYAEILCIKIDKLREEKERPKPQALAKINTLCGNGIHNYKLYIESFRDSAKDELPDRVGEEYEKSYLLAYFHIAALTSRYILLDKEKQIENEEISLKNYQFVYDYCEKNVKVKELILTEFGICKEMIELLPVKIAKLKRDLLL